MRLNNLRPSISGLADSEVIGIVVAIRGKRRESAKIAVDISKNRGQKKTTKTLDDMSTEDLQLILDGIQERKGNA